MGEETDSIKLGITEEDKEDLARKGFLEPTLDEVTQKYSRLLQSDTDSDESRWKEFCNYYPSTTPGPDGRIRVLKAKDPDAKSNSKAKKKYLAYIKNKPELHEKVMEAMKYALDNKFVNLRYLQALETFVNQYSWEKFFSVVEERSSQPTKKPPTYGGNLI